MRTEDQSRTHLRLMYGMTCIRQDANGTWWVGSDGRPDLFNTDTLAAAVTYLDSLPQDMIDRLTQPRGKDSEHG